jgi:hypothetical protein
MPPPKTFERRHSRDISYHGLPVSINFTALGKIGKTVVHKSGFGQPDYSV